MHPPLLVSLLLVGLLAGCTTQQSTSPTNSTVTVTTPLANTTSAPHEISFVATQTGPPGNNTTYAFSGPERAAAGWVTMHLRNDGIEPHQLAIYALGDLSFDAFHKLLMAPPNASRDMSSRPQPMGGVNAASAGANATTVIRLPAGDYALACFIPDPTSGAPHAVHGMIKALHIVNASGPPAPEPTPDTTLTTPDYNFTLDHALTTGTHVVAIKNAGPHQHEAVLIKLKGNATAMDFIHAFDSGTPPGPPPGDAVGGGGTQPVGSTQYALLTLVPGRYALICFEQDSDASPPHFALGMVKEFTLA